jgi:hypothetical protein
MRRVAMKFRASNDCFRSAALTAPVSCTRKSLLPEISTSISYSPMRIRSPFASLCGRSWPSASSESLTKVPFVLVSRSHQVPARCSISAWRPET